ncbi:MAG: type II toxin-antitoxin system VapC family toxin [Pyrinomonadaceae bacterium]
MKRNLLFDTHTFIWWADEPERLSANALAALKSDEARLFLSDVSVWEIQIKAQLGKIGLKLPLRELIASQTGNGVEMLRIATDHILALESLPFHHKDPFDRLLIAQSKIEDLTVVTIDPEFEKYETDVLW